jgi:MoaA/NifB/PqqE/SkfB family radical SAM enzyme
LRVLEATGKTFKINFTGGGEPFLTPNLVEASIEIARKHYVALNTNLTFRDVKRFAENVPPEKVERIVASVHIKELERLHLLGAFVENFSFCKERGFNIVAQEVAYPALSAVEEYKRFFKRNGITLSFSPFLGEYNGRKYPQEYSTRELEAFGLSRESIAVFNQKHKICNAGYNAAIVTPSGRVLSCYPLSESLGSIYRRIRFRKNLVVCPFDFCGSPLSDHDKVLFQEALGEAEPRKPSPVFLLSPLFRTAYQLVDDPRGSVRRKVLRLRTSFSKH